VGRKKEQMEQTGALGDIRPADGKATEPIVFDGARRGE